MRRLRIAVVVLSGVIAATVVSSQRRTFEAERVAAAQRVLADGVLRPVVLGDSVAHGAGDERGRGIPGALDERLRALGIDAAPAVNFGIDGARTHDVQRLLSKANVRSTVRAADMIVLSIGGNDLYGDSIARVLATLVADHQQARVLARIQRVVGTLRDANPAARIYILGLYNPYQSSRSGAWIDRQINLWDARLIARFAEQRNVTVVRICDLLQRADRISALDRFHPSGAGYAAIAARIAS